MTGTDHILNSDSSELVQTLKCEEKKIMAALKSITDPDYFKYT